MCHRRPRRTPAHTVALLATTLLLAMTPAAQAAKPWVGVAMGTAQGGVRVTRVLPTSPAHKAGFRKGDLITFVNGIQVLAPRSVLRITGKASVGQALSFKVSRGGRETRNTDSA